MRHLLFALLLLTATPAMAEGGGSSAGFLFYTLVPGAALSAASIPLFVCAHSNKVKAREQVGLSLNATRIETASSSGGSNYLPAISLCVNF